MQHADFLLDPDVTFLNHGSFGACPTEVFERYQAWQRELEAQPVAFLGRRHDDLLHEARAALATLLNVRADNLAFVPNATTGINTVAKSLPLSPGDEVLATDHEYGAVDLTWEAACAARGASYRRVPVPLPYSDPADLIDHLFAAVTPRTRAIAISHITSPTALIWPVMEVCRRAREIGVLTVIDGAHAPGQIDLDLAAIAPDFYAGNCHKWLCAPKGSAFLYAAPAHQAMIEPLVTSWGCVPGASFAQRHGWQGTRDIAAYLSVPAAIGWQASHDWPAVRERCHALAVNAQTRLHTWSGLPRVTTPDHFGQMVTVPVPTADVHGLKAALYDRFRVEVPAIDWQGGAYLRLSFQAYNSAADIDRLMAALDALLPA